MVVRKGEMALRRYVSLAVTALLLLAVVIVGTAYAVRAKHPPESHFQAEITVYTTIPQEHAAALAAAYEKQEHVRVHFVNLTSDDLLKKLQSGKKPEAALVLADSATLRTASAAGAFQPYISESGDQVAEEFRQDDGYWTGVWYDPVVFCYNQDYLKTLPRIPDNWKSLSDLPEARIGVTDFLASDAAANLFCSMLTEFGDARTFEVWRNIHPHVVQYARYLSNPVRQAGMGEVDVAVAVESETLRYLHDGYPLRIVYPTDGTSFILTGTGIVKGISDRQRVEAEAFADWLLTDDAQLALQSNNFYLLSTNPGTMAYRRFPGKNLRLFTQIPDFTPQQKHDALDRWVKQVRFE